MTITRIDLRQELPLLPLRNVEYLSGVHRIEAAKAFLDENNQ
jgi:hypothetical protein